jgi:hypothetical protein
MSGGGGKGGSQTQQTQIPDWIREPATRAIDRGERIAEIGYTPYMGPDVAALSAPQMGAMANTGAAASAFGMGGGDPMAGMPAPETFAGGMQGYSSYPLYQQTQEAFAQAYPGQADYMSNFFIDPQSGGLLQPAQQAAPASQAGGYTREEALSAQYGDPAYKGHHATFR